MRLHLVALPHTRVEAAFSWCAYTTKLRLFCKMMGDRHEIVLYAPGQSTVKGVKEFVSCLSDEQRVAIFGSDDDNRLPDWPTDEQSRQFNLNVAAALCERVNPEKDLVLLSQGRTHLPIYQSLPQLQWRCCEQGVGYEGVIGGDVFAAYESHAWRHYLSCKNGVSDVRNFDVVIPPYVDPDEFPYLNDGNGQYLLFLGRLIQRKGPQIAVEIAKRVNIPLHVAGAGGKAESIGEGRTRIVGLDVTLEGNNLVHVGPVGIEARAKLLAGAKALICPTTYLEPGGNVAIEAMMAGTPVITHNWGVYSETVEHGLSGFHFQILREAADAVRKCGRLDPAAIRQYAIDNYSLEAVGKQFDRWFENLQTLPNPGWYAY